MATSRLTRGLILDLLTPLGQNGDLDKQGLARLLNRTLPYVQGILLAGPSGGEGDRLDAGQREELLQTIVPIVRARVPLLVWVTRPTAPETLKTVELLHRRLKKSGYTGEVFWVDTPLFYQGNRGLPRYYGQMVRQFRRGWVLHNDPDLVRPLKKPFKRENIRTSILKQLCEIQGIEGLIFSGSLERAQNYQKGARSAPDFRIYDGEESRFLSHPSLSGIVSVGANLAPRRWQKITRSSLHLDPQPGDEYPDRLQQILEAGAHIGELMNLYARNPVPLLKQVLCRMGVLESPFSFRGQSDPRRVEALQERMAGADVS